MYNFKKDLILLNMVKDLGCVRLKSLLDVFKEPGAVLKSSFEKLRSVDGIGPIIAKGIMTASSDHDVDAEIELTRRAGVEIIAINDNNYPENLKNIYDPPVILYVKGAISRCDEISIAMVGSRRCTCYGMNMADEIARDLAAKGVTIVSGLARGIDTSAHKGALNGRGRTLAVLGSGLGNIYPPENLALSKDIADNGALISEFPMVTPPYRQNFPRRNRLISGISKAVVVVEAARKSGALITVDFALEQGRDVFAVPGMANRPSSRGANALIKQGAKLIDNAEDILEELGIAVLDLDELSGKKIVSNPEGLDGLEKKTYLSIPERPCYVDDIARFAGISQPTAQSVLFHLQVKGLIKRLPGGFFEKVTARPR
ncbi:MAG: DNA-processing protein DprA [Candidatus Omnitrophota bacterium]|jgi:DNA processing protein